MYRRKSGGSSSSSSTNRNYYSRAYPSSEELALKEERDGEIYNSIIKGDLQKLRTIMSRDECQVFYVRQRYQDLLCETPFQLATVIGNLEIVQFLAETGVRINSPMHDGATPLYVAAERGDLKMVQFLVNQGADVNSIRHGGFTPLFAAAKKGYSEIVQWLADKGADINPRSNFGQTPLLVAACNDHVAVVQALVSRGVAIDSRAMSKLKAYLFTVIQEGDLVKTRELVALVGSEIYYFRDAEELTPLCLAVKAGHLEVVQFLAEAGSKVDEKVYSGRTSPLWVAIKKGFVSIVQLLVEYGADVNQEICHRKEIPSCPLPLAIAYRNSAIATFLIKAGATVTKQIERDLQQLLFSAIENGDIESLPVLLNYKIDIHAHDESGYSTVAVAVKHNHLDICQMLIAHRAEFNDISSDHVPILIAAACGYTHFIEYFVKELKVNINSCDPTGANLLQIAIESGHTELAKWLIDNEANIYQIRNDGTNSLYSALQQQNYEVLEMLLAAGENLELGAIDKHKFSELILIIKQNIEPFREFITYSQQSKNLLSKLQILKIFADFYTSEEKLKIEAAVQKFKDGCELLELAMVEGIEDFYEDAENCFKEVLGQFENSAVIYNILALSCYKQHKMQQALEYSDKALELSPKNSIYQTNKVAIYLDNGMIAEAAETLFYLAKNYYQNKLININTNINELAAVNNNLIDATSEAFREQIFSRVKNIVLKEDKVSEALRPKIHETGIKLIAKALMYLTDVGQDLADEQSISGAMSDFDRIKNQLDDRFEEMKVEMRVGFTEARRDVAKVSVQLEGDGGYRPEFDPALTGEDTAGASSSMDL